MRRTAFLTTGVRCALLTLAVAGCSSLTNKSTNSKGEQAAAAHPVPKGKEVKAGGDGFVLGDVEQPGCSPQQFVDRADELLKAKRASDCTRWIQRFPDMALAVLREPTSVRIGPDVLATLARIHDQQCSRGTPPSTWAELYADRAAHAERYAAYDSKRQEFMVHLQNGRLKEALRLNLGGAAQSLCGPLTAIDAQRLTGIALELDNRPREAVGAFQAALQLAGREHPYQSVNILLLSSDAQRRAENRIAAERDWQEAARLAAQLVAAAPAVVDPILWERISYLHPVQCNWPDEARRALADANVGFGIVADPRQAGAAFGAADEAPLWTAIGHWRLTRGEGQAALVALKRAEAISPQPYIAARLELSQAKALSKLGQTPAASAILIHLADNNEPLISHPAMAMLGTARLQQGGVQQGFNLLRAAVEKDPGVVWPERADAEADLGLAYLLMGDEANGLRWLHEAQQSFLAAGQNEALAQCLENEAAFLDQAKKSDLAKAVRTRIETLRGNG